VKTCREPSRPTRLFQYFDDNGKRQVIDSADVNAYLREISGEDSPPRISARGPGPCSRRRRSRDVATFTSHADAKRKVAAAVECGCEASRQHQGGCRKCYIHPAILDAYMDGATIDTLKARARGWGR